MKKCPYCAEEIQDEAIKCRFCGEILNKQANPTRQITRETFKEKTIKEDRPTLISYSGILTNKVDEIDLAHIRNVSLRQNFGGKIFDYGDVLIGTAGTAGYEIIIKKIKDPQDTIALIKDLQFRIKH